MTELSGQAERILDKAKAAISSNADALASVITFFSALVPALYLIGYEYDNGFLRGFGIDAEMFPRSFQEYLYYSYAFFGRYVISTDFLLLIVLMLSVVAVTVMATDLMANKTKAFNAQQSQFLEYMNKKIEMIKHHKLFSLGRWVMFSAIVIVYIVLAITLLPSLAARKGSAIASDVINSFDSCTTLTELSWGKCFQLIDDKQIIVEGFLVAYSEQKLAIFTGQETQVISIQDSYLIKRKYKSNKTAQVGRLPSSAAP